ncbi:MAG: bifunctional oligoribonuclease/PAP phosphatase NrnA [Phycisphaerales bacterium]
MSGAWKGNANVEDVTSRLARAERVVTLTHSKPDGDALGSSLAVARALERKGARAACAFPYPFFERFEAFVGETEILRLPRGEAEAERVLREWGEPDTVAIVDTGSWTQLADVREWLSERTERAVVIDHHPAGNEGVASLRWVEPGASAATEMVARVCVGLLGLKSARELPVEVAEPLYLGLATDTGFFRYSNTTSSTMRLAAELMDAGADSRKVYRVSEQSDSAARLRLIARGLSNLELLEGDRVAVMCLSRDDFVAAGATADDSSALSDLPQSVASVRVVAVLTEVEPGLTKVSLRSKSGDSGGGLEVDVNAVAGRLGGGGHVRAAGARLHATMGEARRAVIQSIREEMKG